MREVCFVAECVAHYRLDFHALVRDHLASEGVSYRLLYGTDTRTVERPRSSCDVEWGEHISNAYFNSPLGHLAWQKAPANIWRSDMIVLGQENHLLLNYPLQSFRRFGPRVALWGHGRNFQSANPAAVRERWKRWWSTRCHWWFTYTATSAEVLLDNGFPEERVTIFNNTVDTRGIRGVVDSITMERRRQILSELGLHGGCIGIFVGSIYKAKRLPFLIEAALRIHAKNPAFELLIIGEGGEDLAALAAPHPWIRLLGPRFGNEKAELLSLAKVMLMPSHVNLAILDGFAAGLPLVTTASNEHSPEIAYLVDGLNGSVVRDWESPKAYAEAVLALLQDERCLRQMADAARQASESLTIENMATAFSEGVIQALKSPPQ